MAHQKTTFDIEDYYENAVEETRVNLTDCIGPAFYEMHNDIAENRHTYYNLAGGRGSLKSSVIAIEIVLGIVNDPDANAMIFRKVADSITDSVYEQILWAINKLGLSGDFHCTTSPHKCTYLPTGQKIIFKGLDKAKRTKSSKVSRGYFKYLWYEELDEFAGPEEIRTTQQSILRGGPKYFVFKSFNPPRSNNNWANQAFEEDKMKPDVYSSRTTYLEAPVEWLGQQFIDDAEWLKEVNPRAYEHEYLGIPIGTGSNVFDNVVGENITDEQIHEFEYTRMGLDFGWYPDPLAWTHTYLDQNKRILYIFDELVVNKTPNEEVWRMLTEEKGVSRTHLIMADSAEKKSIADFRAYGANIRPVEKGNESVRYGIKWLQALSKIVIDPVRCPVAWKEFTQYEYERTKDGEIINSYPDEDNHCLTGDTIVNTVEGNFMIKDLVGETGVIHCVDPETNEIRVSIFDNVRCTQRNADIYEVELEDGAVFKGTYEHPILTTTGWKLLGELTSEDEIVKIS